MTTIHPGAPVIHEPAVVLVVDDNPAGRYIASSWLRRHGHVVVEAATGADALAVVAERRVDVVVLDVGLPDMSGFEVCEQIKSNPDLTLPVIHLSATAVRGVDRVQGLTRGADAYLVEPVEPGELLATVTVVLRSYRARAAAERLSERLAALTAATLAMNAATTFESLAAAIAEGASGIVGTAAVALVASPDGTLRRAVLDHAIDDGPVHDIAPARVLHGVATHPVDGARGLATYEVPWRLVHPAAADDGVGLALVFGTRSGSPLAVAVHLGSLGDAGDVLAQLGHASVLASDSLRLHMEEHTLALTLQRSFLPTLPDERPGLEIAVRYVPAARNAEIGGDFYEIVELGGGVLLVAIGDVAGHSIHAATVMVEIRHALRAYAVEGHGPSAILSRIDQMMRQYHPREYATVCLLLLDPGGSEVTVANAGHLPPLLVDPATGPPAGATYLPVSGPMLGLQLAQPPDTTVELPPSWSLVLITDGLIEYPGGDLDDALEELRTVSSVDMAPEELCEKLLDRFRPVGRDDVALLALRRRS